MITRNGLPAVNVKTHHLRFPDVEQVMEKFNVGHQEAERALEIAVDCHTCDFWDMRAEEVLAEHLGEGEICAAGRTGGWLVVEGLPSPVEEWSQDLVEKWDLFESRIHDLMRSLASWGEISELIMANPHWLYTNEQRRVLDAVETISPYAKGNFEFARALYGVHLDILNSVTANFR